MEPQDRLCEIRVVLENIFTRTFSRTFSLQPGSDSLETVIPTFCLPRIESNNSKKIVSLTQYAICS